MENEKSLLSVLSQQNLENMLSPQEILTIQTKLWDVLAGRAESFTMGGSSSVRTETAQELLKSAGFVISHGLGYDLKDDTGIRSPNEAVSPDLLREHHLRDDFGALFKSGLEVIKELVKEGESLLAMVNHTATAVENKAYHGMLKELGVFFKRYHYHHFAHDIPCMLDYPLAHPVDETLMGIDYINEYLRRLLIENAFCGRFEPETVTMLLRSVSPDYKENLLSIYEAAAANALALTLLGGDVTAPDVTDRDREQLVALIGAWTEETAPIKLRAASNGLCAILDMGGDAAAEYLALTASELYVRVKPILRYGRLERVFPSLYREKPEKKNTVTYIDGALMDDERLRALIDEITSCRHVKSKIAIVKQNVHSLRDYAEVLNICFWGDEINALFDTLSGEELEQLRLFVRNRRNKFPDWRSETGWETALDGYGRNNTGTPDIY